MKSLEDYRDLDLGEIENLVSLYVANMSRILKSYIKTHGLTKFLRNQNFNKIDSTIKRNLVGYSNTFKVICQIIFHTALEDNSNLNDYHLDDSGLRSLPLRELKELSRENWSTVKPILFSIVEYYSEKKEELPKLKPEAPKNASLGQFAFGDERNIPEKNTEFEKKVLSALEKHVDESHMLDKPYANALKKILRNNQYSNIIKPQTMPIYRGMLLPEDILRKFLKLKKSEKLNSEGKKNVSLIVKPRWGDASSWSDNEHVAEDFAQKNLHRMDLVSVILVALPENNPNKLLDLSAIYSELEGASIISEYSRVDQETIGLGPIKVTEIKWYQY